MKIFRTYLLFAAVFVLLQTGVGFTAEHKDASLYMLRMINDARISPENTLQKNGIPKPVAQANMGPNAWVLDKGVPPLAWNEALAASALAHANDMITNLYYAYDSLNGDTVQDRISDAGYDFVHSGESLGILSFEKYIPPIQAAEIIFKNMLAFELGNTIDPESCNILDENKTEAGIAFVSAVVDLGLDVPLNIYMVVADFASPSSPRRFVIGNVYARAGNSSDSNRENTLAGLHVKLRTLSDGVSDDSISEPNGFFQLERPLGFSIIEVWNETDDALLTVAKIGVFGQNRNILLDILIDK